jgi:hypothetical protein
VVGNCLGTGPVEGKVGFVGIYGRRDPVGAGGNQWVARSASLWWRWFGRGAPGAHDTEHHWCGPWAASRCVGCTVQWTGLVNPFPLFRVFFQLNSSDQISKIQNINFMMSINFQNWYYCISIQMEQVFFLA